MARKEYSSKKLAEVTELSHSTIVNYMNGSRTPRIELLGRIAKALDVDPETLIDQKLGGDVEREVAYENCNSSERFEI